MLKQNKISMQIQLPVFICLIALLLACNTDKGNPSAATEPPKQIEGAWELISQKFIYADSTIVTDMSATKELKIITSSHFVFILQSVDGKEFIGAGGGRYTLKDNIYTETFEFSSWLERSSIQFGQVLEFAVRFEEDRFYQNGRIGDFKLENIFRRAK